MNTTTKQPKDNNTTDTKADVRMRGRDWGIFNSVVIMLDSVQDVAVQMDNTVMSSEIIHILAKAKRDVEDLIHTRHNL